ncbi:MAG: hypothetical protein ACI8QZ_000485 [Chlamydiales bacterium]|jgi:hypothetical protein
MNVAAKLEIVQPIRRVLRWMLSLRDAQGRILCPVHKIEHTGKNAGVIVIACQLAKYSDGEERSELLEVARQQARRLVECLEREGESTCFTFRPGRHDPYNCSNNVIDGGACSDALAEIVETFGDQLPAEERESFTRACVLHAQTYLRYAVLDKGVPAQRAWAMTGVSGAWRLSRHEVLELACTEGAGILEGAQNPDGSFPYHPLENGAGHPGASDVSAFYHSRIPAFLMFSLERIGRDPTNELFNGPIRRALEFLLALQGPDGIKCGLVEAKPWYWGANHEVASHPFDVYALARGWHHFGHARLAQGAVRAFRAWVRHLGADGEPTSHEAREGREASYQCPVFWAGHASWMARAIPDLQRIFERSDPPSSVGRGGIELAVSHFPDASLARLEDNKVVAWIRGARPGLNVHHGSPHGAGLLRVYSKAKQCELLERRPLASDNPAEWGGIGHSSLARGWASGSSELRFSLWLARNDWRAGRFADALARPGRVLRRGVLAFAGKAVSSAFHLTPDTILLPDGVTMLSRLAQRDGTPIEDSSIVRTFRVDGDGLLVEEKLTEAGSATRVAYHVPVTATEERATENEVAYRLA